MCKKSEIVVVEWGEAVVCSVYILHRWWVSEWEIEMTFFILFFVIIFHILLIALFVDCFVLKPYYCFVCFVCLHCFPFFCVWSYMCYSVSYTILFVLTFYDWINLIFDTYNIHWIVYCYRRHPRRQLKGFKKTLTNYESFTFFNGFESDTEYKEKASKNLEFFRTWKIKKNSFYFHQINNNN